MSFRRFGSAYRCAPRVVCGLTNLARQKGGTLAPPDHRSARGAGASPIGRYSFSALFHMRDTLLSAAGALSHPAHVTCTDTPRATRVIKVASHVTTARCIPPPSENGLSATHTLTATFSPRSGGRPSCNERGFGAPSSSVFAHTSASPDRGDTFKPKCGKWVSPSSSCQAGSRPKHVSLRHRGWRVGE